MRTLIWAGAPGRSTCSIPGCKVRLGGKKRTTTVRVPSPNEGFAFRVAHSDRRPDIGLVTLVSLGKPNDNGSRHAVFDETPGAHGRTSFDNPSFDMLSDTHPDAERALIALLREATVAQRGARMLALSATVKELSLRAVARANPGDSEQEVRLKWAELHYGKDLANRVREYLAARSCESGETPTQPGCSESAVKRGTRGGAQ